MRARSLAAAVGLVVTLTSCSSSTPDSRTTQSGSSPSSRAASGAAGAASTGASGGTGGTGTASGGGGASGGGSGSAGAIPLASAKAVARTATWHLPEAIAREATFATGTNAPGAGSAAPAGASAGAALQVLLAGGMKPDNSSTADTWALQLTRAGGSWATAKESSHSLVRLGVAVHDTTGALVSRVPVVFGGGNSSEVSAVQRVSPGTPGGAPAPSGPIGHLPVPNSDLAAVTDSSGVLGTKDAVYIVGGYDGQHPLTSVLRTTDGHDFQTVAHLPQAVRYAALALTPEGLWVIGGEANGRQLDTVQLLAPHASTARVVAHLPTATGHASAGVLGGLIVVAGGRTGTNANQHLTDAVLGIDPASKQIRVVGHLPAPRADAGAVVLPGSGGGASGSSSATGSATLLLLGGEAPHPDTTVIAISLEHRS